MKSLPYIILLLALCQPGVGDDRIAPVSGVPGEAGHRDGAGGQSLFNDPLGMVRDAAGNLYVCDGRSHVVRKITAAGVVSTLAGEPGVPGAVDGVGRAARFRFPTDIALAGTTGILYVADSGNHCIRKITPDGKVTTLAGNLGDADDITKNYGTKAYKTVPAKIDGKGKKARFNSPAGITWSPTGHLYVSDTGNQVIRRIDGQGKVVTIAGSPGLWGNADGSGKAARFFSPQGLCVGTDGNLFIADTLNHTIRRMTPAGVVTTYSGNSAEAGIVTGPRLAARYHEPTDIEPHPTGGFVICDSLSNSLFRSDASGEVSQLAGSGTIDPPSSPDDLSGPTSALSDPQGNVYVADTFNQEVRVILAKFDISISMNGTSREVTLTWDSIPDRVYQVQVFGPQGWESTSQSPLRATTEKTYTKFFAPAHQAKGVYRVVLLGF
jgi:sugar lactone lactonase YvrE